MVGGNNDSKKNSVIWWIIFGVLFLLVIGLAVAIVLVNLNREAELSKKEEQRQAEIQLGNDATEQCNSVNESYERGAISLGIAKQYFENAILENDDEMYKTYVVFCYARFMYDAGEGIESAVAIMDKLEPWLDNDNVLANYYTGLVYLYNEEGDTEKANYYDDLLNKMDGSEEE